MKSARLPLAVAAVLAAAALGGCSRSGSPGATRAGQSGSSPTRGEAALDERVKAYAHYATGISAEIHQNESEALQHFVDAARADPANEDMVLQVASRLIDAKKAGEAVELLSRTAALRKNDGRVQAWLAIAYGADGKTEQAIQADWTAIRRDPLLLMAYQHLALLYQDNRRSAEALKVLDEAADRPLGSAAFFLGTAELYAQYLRLHPDEAAAVKPRLIRTLDRAAALKPQDLTEAQRLADSYKALAEWDKAEAIYLDLLARHPNPPFIHELLADLYLHAGRNDKAAEELRTITRENPSHEQASFFLGTIAYRENKYAEAEELFERTLLLRPDFEPAYYELAGVKLALKKPEDALAVIDKARARFKKTFPSEFYAGLAHAQAKRFDEAIKCYTEAEIIAAATEPARLDHIFFFQLGAAYERKGDAASAEKELRKCLELSPNFDEALNYLGYMWADRGENLEEARQFIERALQAEPDNAAYLDSMGWVLFKLGRSTDALEWLLKAVAKSEEPDATLYDHLGDVYANLKEWSDARTAWQKSLAVESSDVVKSKLDAAPKGTSP